MFIHQHLNPFLIIFWTFMKHIRTVYVKYLRMGSQNYENTYPPKYAGGLLI